MNEYLHQQLKNALIRYCEAGRHEGRSR